MIKKLLIGASALALAAGTASAQTVTIDGKEGGNGAAAATAANSQDLTSDRSDIEQRGDDNTAAVTQNGDGVNSSFVGQASPSGTTANGGNDAVVRQRALVGGRNNARIQQQSVDGAAPFDRLNDPSTPEASSPAGRQLAEIEQRATAGDANNAYILQGVAGAPGTENVALIDQNGEGNDAAIQQAADSANNDTDGNMYSSIDQRGSDNRAENMQGEADFSTIDQEGSGNEAFVRQEAGTGDRNRISTVDQNGESNLAVVNQTSLFSDSFVEQEGNDNEARVTQSSGIANNTTKSFVKQGKEEANSSNNLAVVNQEAGSTGSLSDLTQDGRDNITRVTQSGANSDSFAYVKGVSNDATVTQRDSRNVSVVFQEGFNTGVARNNQATVDQLSGSANTFSYVAQDGIANVAQVTMTGEGEHTAVTRADSREGYRPEPPESQVWQIGNRNRAELTQDADFADSTIYQGVNTVTGAFDAGSERNVALVTQEIGATNASSGVYQTGDRNFASVNQSGMDVESLILQDGDNNDARVRQDAQGAYSLVTQLGGATEGNSAIVRQLDSAGAISTIFQSGNGNVATVRQ